MKVILRGALAAVLIMLVAGGGAGAGSRCSGLSIEIKASGGNGR